MDRANSSDQGGRRASEVIAAELRRRIIQGEIGEGEPFNSERELVEEFGVSRPTLREALRVLDSESLIDVPRGARSGPIARVPRVEKTARYLGLVLEYQHATMADVFAAACALEAQCAGILASSRSHSDIEKLRVVVAAEEAALGQPEKLLALQNEFHRLVVDLAGIATLGVMIGLLRELIEIATNKYLIRVSNSPEVRNLASKRGFRAHRKLVELIEARETKAAEDLWRRQIEATGEHLRRSGVSVSVIDVLG